MTAATRIRSTTSTPTDQDAVKNAERRMYDAECALHAARQAGIDRWVVAAYERLHEAIAARCAALNGPGGMRSPAATATR